MAVTPYKSAKVVRTYQEETEGGKGAHGRELTSN